MIAALFVETGGCYWNLPDVDPWDRERDARKYAGPHPVVAHPPCERWGRFATGSPLKKTYKLGDDGGCFEAAFQAVGTYGGVLEHPAASKAWDAVALPKPPAYGWQACCVIDGWVCEVEQGHYGHPARKATWLLYVGQKPPGPMIWGPAAQRLPAKRLAERG